jgi:hypothetical protein
MNGDNIQLPRMRHVSVFSGAFQKILDIVDPMQEIYHRIKLEQLIEVMKVDLKYQNKMITVEMERLKVQQEAIGEMEKLMGRLAG